jgi:hypothetical protein
MKNVRTSKIRRERNKIVGSYAQNELAPKSFRVHFLPVCLTAGGVLGRPADTGESESEGGIREVMELTRVRDVKREQRVS